ncbi:LppX_LprAFG lipoprotein [Ktedonosporobacter rubrisoli]|uniref:LppX_LprAFG lipoprotein n=1 Tax=Ktedonosporobacter rubrisoli TaxID=2509675 RepID=A0A4P6JIW2_KTERU|nr:DUF6612 family protein [Ktedonosporobacter rubrisoli]QBD75037.1 LppX_LprAFG lipoprotein [Ktedonosporobacter rubrisoli]
MILRKTYIIPLFLTLCLMVVLSACSPLNSENPLSLVQVVQNSINAMKNLKSSHVDIQATNKVEMNGASASTTSGPSNFSMNVTGSGDQALPDQEKLDLTLNQDTKLTEILQGDKVYVQNAQGQWYVFNKSEFTNSVGNYFSGENFNPTDLLGLLLHASITDHGDQDLNGQKLRHITANLDKEALRELLSSNPQLRKTFGQQNIDTVINNAKSFLATVDVWIDNSQYYLHRTQLKLNMEGNVSQGSKATPEDVKVDLNTIMDLSKFNEPVTITPPSKAIPTDDPSVILGNQ